MFSDYSCLALLPWLSFLPMRARVAPLHIIFEAIHQLAPCVELHIAK